MVKNNTLTSSLKAGIKIAGPIGGFLATMADIFSPLAPFAPIILFLSIGVFIYFYFFRIRPSIKEGLDWKSLESNRNMQVASFSLITAVIMLLFTGITMTYSDEEGYEGGILAANFEGINNFQENILGTLDEISETQKTISSDVKDIKDIVTGEAEIKQLASTDDFSVFEDVNKRTTLVEQKTIAILYFDNGSNNEDLNPLKKGLADMLISDLSNLSMLRVVEREKLQQIINELNLSNQDTFDDQTRQKIGQLLGAETLLFGSYFEMIGQFRMDARIVNTETGEIVKSEGVSGTTTDFMKLEKQLVWKIARGLDIRFTEKEKSLIMVSEDISYEAALAFSDGLELFDQGNTMDALERFKTAVKIAPNFNQANAMIDRINNG
jgi:TolB-like protein